jgi:Ca-activated chloride channel family protein
MSTRRQRNRLAQLAASALAWAAIAAVAAVVVAALRRWVWSLEGAPLEVVLLDRDVTFLEPRAFQLALLAPVVLALQRLQLTDFHALQRALNALVRLALIAALAIALARPSLTRFDSHVCTVVLVDVSESMPDDAIAAARESAQGIVDARTDGLVRLVTFAAGPRVEPLPASGPLPPLVRHESGGTESNPAAALRASYGLCPQDHLKRVVLFTDGNENRGDLVAEAAVAAQFGVRIDVVELPIAPAPEVLVRGLEMPEDIRLSEPFTMTAEVWSNRATTARVNLTQNEFRDIRGREVSLEPGLNRVEFPAEVYEPGFRRFTFEIVPDELDRFSDNNTFVRSVTVEGRPRVLYVEGESRSRGYLQRALDRERNDLANFDLEVRGALGFPTTVEEMAGYDLIILSDVEASYISRSAMESVETYVRTLGGGFLMVGGENSFGPGGFDNTPFEEIAPVTFDMQRQRDMPSLAILLVIDRSGSMDGVKLEMAKDAARAVVDLLGPQDSVGVIAFDDVPDVVVRVQNASNRSRIRSDIGRIGSGGGTNIFPALQEAYLAMLDTAARIKHVIVLTDGQAPWDGIADITSSMRSDGITVSSVAVGREADSALLEMIAELGGGRFYQTNDPGNIPQIFVQETSQVARTNLVEEPFRAITSGRAAALRGIAWESAPYLLGYVRTQPKRGAELLLTTEQGDPLFARWRQGLGRVAVFTSDIKNRWAVEWVRSPLYPQFWAQAVRDMMRVQSSDELGMDAVVREGRAHIVVDAIDASDRFLNGLRSTVDITAPDGARSQVELRQVAAGRYEAVVPLASFGPYQLQAEHTLDGSVVATSFGAVTYPYPDEYLAVEPRPALARQAMATTGGLIDPAPAQVWDPGDALTEYREELWPWALFAALGVLVLDLLLRRVRFFGRRPVAWSQVRRG